MAKPKRREATPMPSETATATSVGRPAPELEKAGVPLAGAPALDPPLVPPTGRFSLGAYVLMNVLFDAFCLLQLLLVSLVLKEEKGLYFFFGLLMVAFFVVSVFDYLYDRHVEPVPEANEG